MSGKRIGLVLSSVPPYSETFFKTKINGLALNGFRIYLFAAGRRNHELKCTLVRPYPVYRASWARVFNAGWVLPLTFVRAPARVLRLIKMERKAGVGFPTILKKLYRNAHILPVSMDWLHFGFATMALGREEIASVIGARMAVSFRGYDLAVYPLRHPGCYSALWQYVDQVHSISLYLLAKGYTLGLPRTKAAIVITPALNHVNDEEKRGSELQRPLRILTVARLTWIKGLEYGIRAMAILKALNIPFEYSIIGEGPDEEKLLFEIQDLDLTGVVQLLGRRDHGATLRAMDQADIYLQPSLNEGFCNSILEAQAKGCLCIASDVGGLRENIVHNVTGWLVPARSPEQLAEAVSRVTRLSSDERAGVVQNATGRVRREFLQPAHVEKWINFYDTKR